MFCVKQEIILCHACNMYTYLNPDVSDGNRLTVTGINRTPHATSHTCPVCQPQSTCVTISWTANRLSGAGRGIRPLDPPHSVYLCWAQIVLCNWLKSGCVVIRKRQHETVSDQIMHTTYASVNANSAKGISAFTFLLHRNIIMNTA